MTPIEMNEEFQCPGCVVGSDVSCGKFKQGDWDGSGCVSHVVGTASGSPNNLFALGLPRGFNKPPANIFSHEYASKMEIRVWPKGTYPEWDNLNVPVWAMEKDGFLFVRTVMPRVGRIAVDIVEGGTLSMTPKAIDVAAFVDQID